jgi:hypothetical protein
MIQVPSTVPTWRVQRGLAAAAIAALLLEAVGAGSSRDCMPSFSLNILAGQIILFTVFGAPALAVVGAVAFICAAVPSLVSVRSWLAVASGLVATVAIVLATQLQGLWALPFGGMFVGLVVRSTERYGRWWFPIGIVLALLIAAVIFAFGHYGQNNCSP